MPHYQSFDPQAELSGISLLGFAKSIMREDIAPTLTRHQLDHIDPQAWYPVQTLLDMFNELSGSANLSSILVSLGVAVAQIALETMPPDKRTISLEQFFRNYDALWQSRHRNGDVGRVSCQVVNGNHLILTVKTPYPDDIIYGLVYAYTRFFCPPDKTFSVAYDDKVPTRDNGGADTIMHIHLQD